MSISLYDVSVRSYLQTLGAASNVLAKGRSHCEANGTELSDVVETSLYPDMLPFRFQIVSVAHHSLGAIRGVESGLFEPPSLSAELDYQALENLVAEAQSELQKYTQQDVDAFEGKDFQFKMGKFTMDFTAEGFLMSFSLPNFYFHATTAYDILRMQGVAIGKMDYMGQMRLKT